MAKQFHQKLTSQVPEDYSTEKVDYYENFSTPSFRATQIAPCKAIADPFDQPFCHTKLTLFESESAESLQDSISQDPVLSTYSKRFQEKLLHSKLPNEVSLVFTPQALMCLGTGGETCMRRR